VAKSNFQKTTPISPTDIATFKAIHKGCNLPRLATASAVSVCEVASSVMTNAGSNRSIHARSFYANQRNAGFDGACGKWYGGQLGLVYYTIFRRRAWGRAPRRKVLNTGDNALDKKIMEKFSLTSRTSPGVFPGDLGQVRRT
jgi:hypothetical protein